MHFSLGPKNPLPYVRGNEPPYAVDALAIQLKLSDAELEELLPSGKHGTPTLLLLCVLRTH